MPERVVAGFSLRPVPFLSQTRGPRVAIGQQPGLAPPVLRHRTITGFVIASHPEPFDFAQGEGWRGNRLNGEIATSALAPLGPPRNDAQRGCAPR